MEPIKKYYNEKSIEGDDERSIMIDDDDNIPGPSNQSLKEELKSNIGETFIKTLTGQGYNKIRIDQDLLKKNILKVRYISNNRKIHNKFLKDDYQIS